MIYPGPGQAALLYKNRLGYFFQGEQIGGGLASVAFQLARIDANKTGPFGMSFQAKFSGPVGILQLDIQTSDIDEDAAFITYASLTQSSLNSNNQGRVELPNIWAKYVRTKMVQLTNGVNSTISGNH